MWGFSETKYWRSTNVWARWLAISLLLPLKKNVIVHASSSPDYSYIKAPSNFALSPDNNPAQVRSHLNPAALPDLTLSPAAVSRLRRSSAGPDDLSAAASGGGYGGGYGGGGYGHSSCDCSGYDVIGLIAGGASLAGVAVFLINQLLNNNNNGGGRDLYWSLMPELSEGMSERLADMLPPPTEMSALRAVNRTCDVISDMERSQISVSEGRAGYGGSECECFPGLAGALAGFAALGALIAFAVAQAIANANMNTGTGTGGGRALDAEMEAEEFLPGGLSVAGAMLALLVADDASCLPRQLCRLNSRARRAGYPYNYVVRVASLPLAWVLMKTTGEPMTNLCTGVTSRAADGDSCDVTFPHCAS